jgi:single-strand DNA-binding protein
MSSLNRATLLGRVGKDPEIKQTNGGGKVASFSIATSESWTSKQTGERQEKTQWHNIVVWNEKIIDHVLAKYVHKGDQIYLEGQIETRKWQDQGGSDRWTTEIVVKAFDGKVVLIGGRKEGGGGDPSAEQKGSAPARPRASADIDDDIPFAPCMI